MESARSMQVRTEACEVVKTEPRIELEQNTNRIQTFGAYFNYIAPFNIFIFIYH